jgi:hypothetical protein
MIADSTNIQSTAIESFIEVDVEIASKQIALLTTGLQPIEEKRVEKYVYQLYRIDSVCDDVRTYHDAPCQLFSSNKPVSNVATCELNHVFESYN